ncbi:MAG TPA: hypothetical protein VGN18_13455 [Jatrophihabitans sp.]|jgi:hypothetical protein|uniref:hypothetical protein n=1 Tax=Jatrophihabitans sp. TaxID=1932789 RepID=UPI002DFB06DA|nr:hypothetical protein [Jatrophihabitans sp.]
MVNVQNSQEQITKSQDTGTYSGTYDEIKNEFNQLNPAPINVACTAWSKLASHLGTVANDLKATAGTPLHEAWESRTSPDAQQQLQLAQATAQALADQCMQMARATDWAYQYAQWYKAHVPGDGLITTSSDADAINQHRVALLSRYNEVIGYCIPSQVQSSLVQNNAPYVAEFHATPGPGPGPGPMGPGPGPGPGMTPVAPIPPTHPIPPHHVNPPPPHEPGPTGPGPIGPGPGPGPLGPGPLGPGPGPGPGSGCNPHALPTLDNSSALAGFDPSGGGAGGGLGAGGASGLGAASGLGGGGLGSGGPGAGGLGAGSASGLAGSGAGMGAGAGSGGSIGAAGGVAGGAGGRPGTMMPMHGSGQGSDDERERSTWLAEDDDIWGADDAPPGVIGG